MFKKNSLFFIVLCLCIVNLKAQQNQQAAKITTEINQAIATNYQMAKPYFEQAYLHYPTIPKGILEAVSYTNTRFYHITHHPGSDESCMGLPKYYGVMGLVQDGKNYFRNNLITISDLSGVSVEDINTNPEKNILAYAAAYHSIKAKLEISSMKPEDQTPILIALSELPLTEDIQNNFALNSHLYSVYYFLNNSFYQSLCGFPAYQIDFIKLFGENNYKILSSPHILMSDTSVTDTMGLKFQHSNPNPSFGPNSTDYGPALWDLACTSNFTVGRTQAISAITIHDVEGSYAGCISWFNNCSANVSAHYVLRSVDGQITQMVAEIDKAWHVGTENPYTIGYEHEGYAGQSGWYTVAMYNASAALSRDICISSGYNINPLRTGFWPWLATTNYNISGIPGSCVKVKGHQHYPNQTHTDPGQYWDWDYYYKMVNNPAPTPTTYTNTTGTLYDSGGPSGNYSDDERSIWVISPPSSSSVTLTFTSFDVENTWDYLYIYNGTDVWAPLIGYYTGTSLPGAITANSGSMTLEFRSDCATPAAGWNASWTSVQPDMIDPTTSISTTGLWKTHDFTATFNDVDNIGGSGIDKSFYQVLENNNNIWGANAQQGFFCDNFDTLMPSVWSTPLNSGTWSSNGGYLVQSDTSVGNTNIYASLDQELSNRYLYHFTAKVGTGIMSGFQRRFGFHFFCDNAALPNRNNSYFVFFRVETSQLEFYKVTNDVFTQVKVVTGVVTNANQWYDYKVFYDRISGLIAVYRDDVFLGSWIDTSPYSTGGNYISFRTGNSHLWIGELKVFRSRAATATITIGPANTNMIRVQNQNPSTYAAKIKSICTDNAGNLSAIAYHDLNIDWTTPTGIAYVNDGSGVDIDTIATSTDLYANWASSGDTNSDIAAYWYAVGTTAGDSNFVAWTNNALSTNIHLSGLSMNPGTTYYVSVRAVDGAGLLNSAISSDGQFVALAPQASFTSSPSSICAGDSVLFTSTSINATNYFWEFTGGNPSTSILQSQEVVYSTAGSYNVKLKVTGTGGSDSVLSNSYVIVNPLPIASFTTNNTLVDITNAYVYFTNNSTNATSYLWNFGDGNTSTDFAPWHLYSAEGYYTVTLIAYSSLCGNDTTVFTNYVHVTHSVGIDENPNALNLTLTPNPSNGTTFINYDLENTQQVSISLMDAIGKKVFEENKKQTAGHHTSTINATTLNLAKGIYLMHLQSENKSVSVKMFVE